MGPVYLVDQFPMPCSGLEGLPRTDPACLAGFDSLCICPQTQYLDQTELLVCINLPYLWSLASITAHVHTHAHTRINTSSKTHPGHFPIFLPLAERGLVALVDNSILVPTMSCSQLYTFISSLIFIFLNFYKSLFEPKDTCRSEISTYRDQCFPPRPCLEVIPYAPGLANSTAAGAELAQ